MSAGMWFGSGGDRAEPGETIAHWHASMPEWGAGHARLGKARPSYLLI